MSLRNAISDSLHRRLDDAKAEYQLAKAEYFWLMDISRATADLNDPGFVDGTQASRQALNISHA